MSTIIGKGAVELAAMIASRSVTSAEVVDAHLARIAEINPTINAVRVTLADEARAAAAKVDSAIKRGDKLGPLAGVPISVKENIDVKGSATTWGVAAFVNQIATRDAPQVARLREAGAIPFARTNLPDFAFRWDAVGGAGGRTLNPWDLTRSPGGTSGGEAAALATGLTPLGLGNDLGGSLRVPAQMCGILALRPTKGRIPEAAVTQPATPPMAFQVTNSQGPMARKVADLRLAFGLMAAPDVRDPRYVPLPAELPRPAGRIRVAVVRNPAGLGIDPHVRAGIDRTADWLADAGYDVVDVEPPRIEETAAAWFEAVWADVGAMLPSMEPVVGKDEAAFIHACLEQGVFKPVNQAAQMASWMKIYELGAEWMAFQNEYPVILSPVCCEKPWKLDRDITHVAEIAKAMRMVVAVNILGLPSLAVPVGADEGLPQGVQLIGRQFREDLLLDAAAKIEARAPALTPIVPAKARKAEFAMA